MAFEGNNRPPRISPHFWLNAVGTATLVSAFQFQASLTALTLGLFATSLTSYGGSLYLWRMGRTASQKSGAESQPEADKKAVLLLAPPASSQAPVDTAGLDLTGTNVARLPFRERAACAPVSAVNGGQGDVRQFPLTRCRYPNETPAAYAARIERLRNQEKSGKGPGSPSP